MLVLAVPVLIIANLADEGQGAQIHRERRRRLGPVLDKHTPHSVQCLLAIPLSHGHFGLKSEAKRLNSQGRARDCMYLSFISRVAHVPDT